MAAGPAAPIKAALAPARSSSRAPPQVAQLRRTVTKNGRKTVEVVVPHHQRP